MVFFFFLCFVIYIAVVYLLSRVRLFRNPMDCSSSNSSVHGISQARTLEWFPFPSPGGLSDPGIEPSSPALTGGFFTTEPSGKSL